MKKHSLHVLADVETGMSDTPDLMADWVRVKMSREAALNLIAMLAKQMALFSAWPTGVQVEFALVGQLLEDKPEQENPNGTSPAQPT